jgi:two-component system sensor histidine kinase/response regulator
VSETALSGVEPAAPAIDVARLERLRDLIGDAEFRRLARTFLDDLARRTAAMAELGATGDLAGLARDAHTLRGTAGSYGLESVAALAGRLEAACTEPDAAGAIVVLDELLAGMAASAAHLAQRFAFDRTG